jgi:hypothetical protein
MKANCLRRRHSRRTDTHVTYWDPFPLAQWQRNSSRDSRLVAKPAPPTGALVLHPGAENGDERRAAFGGFSFLRPQWSAGLVCSFCCGGSNGESCEAAEAATAATSKAAATASATVMSALILKRACCLLTG